MFNAGFSGTVTTCCSFKVSHNEFLHPYEFENIILDQGIKSKPLLVCQGQNNSEYLR